MRIKFRYFFSVYAAVLFYVCMFMVFPAHDDWWYAIPKPVMNFLAGLMPEADFWRPFDRTIECLLGISQRIEHVHLSERYFPACLPE